MTKVVRVLVVDDSASVRQTLADILGSDPGIEVLATAGDPFIAAKRIQNEIPDVILLDVEMPRMDGITFLKKLMAQRPIPVVMCSSVTETGSQALMEALEAGAVDVIQKPRVDTRQFLMDSSVRICDAVKAAARANLGRVPRRGTARPTEKLRADAMLALPARRETVARTADPIVCIGASTGGTESLKVVLEALEPDCPGVVIVQHMPEKFTEAFARRLDSLCRVSVKEAADGDDVIRGRVLIAPGNHHVLLQRVGRRFRVQVKDGPLVSRHRPSVDVLFRSAARWAGANAMGMLMTGMGDDGAQGLKEMHDAGAFTVAQDEATSVVFGMPREAIELGAADLVLPLDLFAGMIMRGGR